MNEFKIEGHESSYLPKGKNWTLAWNDEFDGNALDRSKWGFRRHYWGHKSPTFTDEGAVLDGKGNLELHLIEKDGHFFSPHLQTGSNSFDLPKDSEGFWPLGKMEEPKFMHRYGYYEIRCKLPKYDGWHSAFWLQSPSIGAHPDPRCCGVEVDIMENYRLYTEGFILCGSGYGGYGNDAKWHGHARVPYVETEDGFHRFGVDWSPEGYIYYMDGREVKREAGPVSDVDQFILISTECHGYHRSFNRGGLGSDDWRGKPDEKLKKAVLPDCFTIDYVRVFDAV